MIQKKQLQALISKYQQGQCTDEELDLLESWYLHWNEADRVNLSEDQLHNAHLRSLGELESLIHVGSPGKLWPRYASLVAAAIALIILGVWFFNSERGGLKEVEDEVVVYKNDIAPGKNTATLTLANGRAINLSDAKTGIVVSAGGLIYNDNTAVIRGSNQSSGKNVSDLLGSAERKSSSATKMTLYTPRGGTYQITLADGTKVWLNAASSLTYNAKLDNGAGVRRVELNGEAYFEVMKDKAHPFIVATRNQEVEVLGTHFNINSYPQEPGIKTTLLEGSVKVRVLPAALVANPKDKKWQNAAIVETILKPGEQALLRGTAQLSSYPADLTEAIAWKNGKFRFNNASLEEVMRQLSRWYDVEVVYANGIPEGSFTGGISRNLNASEALSILQFTKMKFRIEGKKIIVTK